MAVLCISLTSTIKESVEFTNCHHRHVHASSDRAVGVDSRSNRGQYILAILIEFSHLGSATNPGRVQIRLAAIYMLVTRLSIEQMFHRCEVEIHMERAY
jgi:hypothetical protein